MREANTPLGLAGTGVVLIIIGLVVKDTVVRYADIGRFIEGVGWFAILLAALIFIIAVIRNATTRP